MMMIMKRLARTLLGDDWKASCEAGAPVADQGGCHHVDCDSVRLTTLGPGERGAVSCLEEPWSGTAAKLAALGILPGVRVRMIQRYPAYILRIGRAELAIDRELADRIRVRPDD